MSMFSKLPDQSPVCPKCGKQIGAIEGPGSVGHLDSLPVFLADAPDAQRNSFGLQLKVGGVEINRYQCLAAGPPSSARMAEMAFQSPLGDRIERELQLDFARVCVHGSRTIAMLGDRASTKCAGWMTSGSG